MRSEVQKKIVAIVINKNGKKAIFYIKECRKDECMIFRSGGIELWMK